MGPADSAPRGLVTAIEAAALLDAVIALSDDAIFTCDLDGMVISWSATAERLFGRSARDVMDAPLHELFPEHLRDEARSVLASVLKGDRIRHFETEIQRPDGMPLAVS